VTVKTAAAVDTAGNVSDKMEQCDVWSSSEAEEASVAISVL